MLIFTIRRLIGSALVLMVTSFLVFWYVATNFDPLKPYRNRQPPLSKLQIDALRHQFKLDQNVFSRYWDWLSNLVHFHASFPFFGFNFGTDVTGNAISPQLSSALGVTSRLIVGAIVLAAVIAVVFGVISGVRRDKPIDITVTIFAFVLIALPTFWFAAVLKDGAIRLNDAVGTHFNTIGQEDPKLRFLDPSTTAIWQDRLDHMLLPVISLGLLTTASWVRYQRASTIEVLEADYMRLARAKGVRNRTVIRRHGLRNALIPLVTVMAIDIGALFGGAVITEKVYVWHGMGDFLFKSFTREDSYAVVGWVMVAGLFVVLFNLLADLLYAVLDPRIRLS